MTKIVFFNTNNISDKLNRSNIDYDFYKNNISHFINLNKLKKYNDDTFEMLIYSIDKYSSVLLIPFNEKDLTSLNFKSFLSLIAKNIKDKIYFYDIDNVFSLKYNYEFFENKENFDYFLTILKNNKINIFVDNS